MATEIKAMTGQRTFPNTFIGKIRLGGCDDTKAALKDGQLKKMISENNIASNII